MSDVTLDYTHSLDRVDLISGLLVKLRDIKDGNANNPGLLKRIVELFPSFGGFSIEQARDQIMSQYDTTIAETLKTVSSSQRASVACIRALIYQNNSVAPTVDAPFDRYYKQKNLADRTSPDILYLLLMRPTNQFVFGSLDQQISTVLHGLRSNIRGFVGALDRVRDESPVQVLAEVKYELEALVDNSPENKLRAWLDKTTICTGGRPNRRVKTLLELTTKQANLVRPDEWYPNWFNTISKLPEANGLFGKHETSILKTLEGLDEELGLLASVKCSKVPPYIGQLIAEFGYQVYETLETIQNLVAIRSLFIKKYNEVKTQETH
jgi:hypothetical protein